MEIIMGNEIVNEREVAITKASKRDAEFVAWTVLTALGMEKDDIEIVTRACSDERSMYSWRNSLVAKVDGECIGCLISYDGALYEELREYTWPEMWGGFTKEYLKEIAYETQAGEYYLDSMAILPEYRGMNIGHKLMVSAIESAKLRGFTRFALIVDVNKPHLQSYYEEIGFKESGVIEFFSHQYKRMVYQI